MGWFGTGRIGLSELAGLCRRLSISVRAGITDRKMWAREAEHGSRPLRRHVATIRDAVARGDGVGDAVAETGAYFPPLVREMVRVGEETGKMADVLVRIAEYYEHRTGMRRTFLAGIAWPIVQLVAAIVVIGILIWVMGAIGGIDLLGFGLMGTSGVAIYAATVGSLTGLGWLLVAWVRRGGAWSGPVQSFALSMPVVGTSLRTMALARLTWTLHLTLDVDMDLRRVVPIALSSTGLAYYRRHSDRVVADLESGSEIHEALHHTGAFPPDLVQAVEVAEQSGRLVESMSRLSKQYEEEAASALSTLAVLAGFAVWLLVAAVIIFLIFRLASSYVGILMDAAAP